MSGPWKAWPGESNGTQRTSGFESVPTPDCPVCGGEVSGYLPNHLRYQCEGAVEEDED